MKLHDLLQRSYETFQEKSPSARVILLHPNSRYRSMLVAKLISSDEHNVFYYAMGPDDLNLPSFLSGITHDLANQHPMFGRHLNMLPAEAYGDLTTLLTTFARDLAEIDDKPYLLILDEYDRSDSADDVQTFIEKLVAYMPENCQLVINSRTLPRLPWISMIARGRAILLEDEDLIVDNFYNVSTEGINTLEVYALGPGFVLMDGEPIDAWEGHLPRLLFFFALDRPIITRSEICSSFWPDLETDQAVNVFHVTKRRLHKALDMDVLVHEDGYYRINPELGIQYDVTEFVSELMAGRNENNPNRFGSWKHAADLYRGPFLQGHPDDWIASRREDFMYGYLEALTCMAEVRLEQQRPENALTLYQQALLADNTQDQLHRTVMNLFVSLGRRSEAAAHFQNLVEDLKRVDQEPSTELTTLYSDITA